MRYGSELAAAVTIQRIARGMLGQSKMERKRDEVIMRLTSACTRSTSRLLDDVRGCKGFFEIMKAGIGVPLEYPLLLVSRMGRQRGWELPSSSAVLGRRKKRINLFGTWTHAEQLFLVLPRGKILTFFANV